MVLRSRSRRRLLKTPRCDRRYTKSYPPFLLFENSTLTNVVVPIAKYHCTPDNIREHPQKGLICHACSVNDVRTKTFWLFRSTLVELKATMSRRTAGSGSAKEARVSGGHLANPERLRSVVITPSDSAARALSSLLATLDSTLAAGRSRGVWPAVVALLCYGTCLITPFQVIFGCLTLQLSSLKSKRRGKKVLRSV